MGRLRAKSDYEDIRNARILQNQEKLASLGLKNTISELRSISSSVKTKRKYCHSVSKISLPLRRSDRLKLIAPVHRGIKYCRRSGRLKGKLFRNENSDSDQESEESCYDEEERKRPANAPLIDDTDSPLKYQLSPEALARRCDSSGGRGKIYNTVFGICCHFCRQKTLCSEEDCKRCGSFDMDQPCIGKTDCSVCHSSNGVLCRACLKVRYGEEMEEVIENKKWMCPHCVEEKGINPYWICNSSFCLKKRKMAPTGIAIYRAREMGYESVAHLLMDQLKRANSCKR